MRCIAVINQKGGVGKTTTTLSLGAGIARRGKRVLLLDLDPQGNLSLHVDRRPDDESATMTALLLEQRALADVVQSTGEEGLFIVPSESSLGGVEQILANKIGREMVLRDALEKYVADSNVPFDFVLLDCPPSLGVISANALCAAGEVLIPMQADYFSLQGMAKLTEVIELVRSRLNPELRITRVVPCMVDFRTRLTAEVLAEIEHHFGDLVSRYPIRSNVKLAEAPSFGRTIFEHDPESAGAWDYGGLAAEILGERYELDEDDDTGGESSELVRDARSERPPEADARASAEDAVDLARDLDPHEEEAIVKAMLEGDVTPAPRVATAPLVDRPAPLRQDPLGDPVRLPELEAGTE